MTNEEKLNSIEERATAEKEDLRQLLFDCGISEDRLTLLDPVIENVAWMRIQLEEARKDVKTSKVVIKYDNGGGQSGLRENPLFKGYEALWKSYMSGLSKLLDLLPPAEARSVVPSDLKPKTVLEIVRAKKKKEA